MVELQRMSTKRTALVALLAGTAERYITTPLFLR